MKKKQTKPFSAFATGFNVISTGLMQWVSERRKLTEKIKKKGTKKKFSFQMHFFPLLTAEKLDSTGWLPKSV